MSYLERNYHRSSGISLIQKEQIPSPKSLDSVESSASHQSRKSILLFDIRLAPKLRLVCLVKRVVKLGHVFNSAALALYAGMLYAINFSFYPFYCFLVGGTNIQFLFSTHTVGHPSQILLAVQIDIWPSSTPQASTYLIWQIISQISHECCGWITSVQINI